LSLRKCVRPTFTWVNFDSYVSQTYFVIKTDRWNMRALTAILNSTLIAFWLRRRGKMQGDQYQVDKAPLTGIPLVRPDDQSELAGLADVLLDARSKLASLHQLMVNALTLSARDWMSEQEAWWREADDTLAPTLPTDMSPVARAGVLELISAHKTNAADLDRAIEEAEEAVDRLVYDLYGLSEEQAQVVRRTTPGVSPVG
jgi:hypothetical protein